MLLPLLFTLYSLSFPNEFSFILLRLVYFVGFLLELFVGLVIYPLLIGKEEHSSYLTYGRETDVEGSSHAIEYLLLPMDVNTKSRVDRKLSIKPRKVGI